MLIFTAKLLGIIPKEYPDTCECGFFFNTSGQNGKMTNIKCTNPYCPVESQFTIVEMLEKLGIKANLGEEKAGIIINHIMNFSNNSGYVYRCCIDLLGIPDEYLFTFPSTVITPIGTIQNEVKRINSEGGIILPTYMSLWCFEGLGETYCKRIFSTYSSIEEFYKDFEKDPKYASLFIAKFLNQSPFTDTVLNITKILQENKDEIIRCSKYFVFRQVPKSVLQLCITGEITKVLDDNGLQFKPRDKFADYIRNKYNINVILNKSFNKAVDFVVCDKPSATRKAEAARNLERKDVFYENPEGAEICKTRLLSSDILIKIIEKGV